MTNPAGLIIFGIVLTVDSNNFVFYAKYNMWMSVMHYKVTTQCDQSGFTLASSNQNPVSNVTECLTGLLFHFYKQWPL